MTQKPNITVYIPCRHYGHFLGQAIESVVAQSRTDWELIIVDDGSVDETATVAAWFEKEHPERIRVLRHTPSRGLGFCANLALEAARGEYVMRLDADDFLDENALLVLASHLDRHSEVALVYPNFICVGEFGEVLGVENRKKIGREAKLLDLPAHGACTLVRKRVLKSIGGYSETTEVHDGYELWLKVLHRYPVANVSTPLFYYRQHEHAISNDESRILAARQRIKRALEERSKGKVKPRVVAVIPAKNTSQTLPNVILTPLVGRPLIDFTLDTAQEAGIFDAILVTTDDPAVVEYCSRFPGVLSVLRPSMLSSPKEGLSQVLNDATLRLENEHKIYPDVLVLLSVHSPLRRPEHIREAVDTLLLYNVDSVISVYQDYELHFTHGPMGLEPLNRGMLQRLRLEREALYVDNGAIKVCWRNVVEDGSLYGQKIGHVIMPGEDSFQIKKPFDAWLIERILCQRKESAGARSDEVEQAKV